MKHLGDIKYGFWLGLGLVLAFGLYGIVQLAIWQGLWTLKGKQRDG